MGIWSAPVRYAECDQQGVVFNSHYLLWCDEALSAFCRTRGAGDLAERVQVVTSTLTWTAPVRHRDLVDVDVECLRVGRTSMEIRFAISAGGRPSCEVRTTYVLLADGRPAPFDDDLRATLTTPRGRG